MLYNGDCLEIIDTLKENSVDILFIDPPYIPPEHSKTLTKYKKTLSEFGILESFFKTYFSKIDKILKKDGRLLIFCNSDSYPLFYIHLFPYVKKIRCLVWNKIRCSLGYTFRHQHELILYAERVEAKAIKCGIGDIFNFNVVKANTKDHPAEKPVDLLEHIIKHTSNENDYILDTFMGTGSIGVACKNLKRKYIGIEMENCYFNLASEKLK